MAQDVAKIGTAAPQTSEMGNYYMDVNAMGEPDLMSRSSIAERDVACRNS